MTQRTYGTQYDRSRTVKDDAASIRNQVKAAQRDGRIPAGWKVTVRTRKVTHSQAIDVHAASPKAIYAADPMSRDWVKHSETGEYVMAWADKYTLEAASVRQVLQALWNAHNHDGSDAQVDYFDVKFYGEVTLGTVAGVPEWEAAAA